MPNKFYREAVCLCPHSFGPQDKLNNISSKDALEEGLKSAEEYLQTFLELYKTRLKFHDKEKLENLPVWVIKFELIDYEVKPL